MGFVYQQRRVELVARVLSYAARLGLADDYVHDAVLLMDRTMSTSLQACHPPPWNLFSPLHLFGVPEQSSRQGEMPIP